MADTGELIHVDPAQLVIGENVRVDADVDPHLVASVKRRGVLEPIVAYRDGDGRLVVLHGQRRTCAAVKAGSSDVPVWVRDAPDAADRIVDQVAENDHRSALAAADRLAAYEQLSAIGLSAAQIAHRAAKPRVEIDAALKTVASPAARTAVAEHGLTIEQAAAIAEFEHRPGAVVRLIESAQDGGRGWEHRLQYFRLVVCPAHGLTVQEHVKGYEGDCTLPPPPWADGSTKDECGQCEFYGGTGMHWDTCPNRGRNRRPHA